MREGAYVPQPESLVHTERIIREFNDPSPFAAAAELPKLRSKIRDHIFMNSGARMNKARIPKGKVADYFHTVKGIAAAQGDRKKIYAKIAEHLAVAEALLEQDDSEVRRSGLAIVELTGYDALLRAKIPRWPKQSATRG